MARCFARFTLPILVSLAAISTPRTMAAQHSHRVMFRTDMPRWTVEIGAPADQVTQGVKAVFEQLQMPLADSTDRQMRLLFTPYLRASRKMYGRNLSDFFGCQESDIAGGNRANQGQVTFAILARVRPTNHGVTVLELQVEGRVMRIESRTTPIECATTGLLEKSITDAVQQLVRDTAPQPDR
jgi:hypothetical protein